MVRITSGVVPRLRLMSVRTNRGRRFRTLVAFALSFLLVASGFYGANSLADQHEEREFWNGNTAYGTVEVSLDQGDRKNPSSSISLTLGPGESKTYYVRLSKQPLTNGWFVLIRARVNGAMLANGYYPSTATYHTADITWVPSIYRTFNMENGKDPSEPTVWKGVRIKAKKNLAEPVTINITHEVWEDDTFCPIHEVGQVTVNVEPTEPGAPTLNAAPNGQTKIDLSWNAPHDGGETITRYALQVSDNGTSGWTNLASSLGATVRSHNHTNLLPGTRKYYRIQARNSRGAGGWSNVADATTEADVPGAPVLRAAPDGETQIDLSWDKPATNGADITRYELQVSDDGNSSWSGLGGQISASTTSHDHTGLTTGTKKYYQIRAYNSVGFGPWRAASATTQSANNGGGGNGGNPDTNTPDTNTPDTNTPDTNTPDTNTPDTNTPDTNTPDTNTPDTNTPDTNTPDTNTPDTNTPDTNTPDTNTPDTNTPDTNTPDTNTPDTNTPDTNTPDTNTPDTNTPDTNTPDTNTPDTNTPDTNTPDTNTPDTNTPDTNTPAAANGKSQIDLSGHSGG